MGSILYQLVNLELGSFVIYRAGVCIETVSGRRVIGVQSRFGPSIGPLRRPLLATSPFILRPNWCFHTIRLRRQCDVFNQPKDVSSSACTTTIFCTTGMLVFAAT